MPKTPRQDNRKLYLVALFTALVVGGLIFLLLCTPLKDHISALGYAATPELNALKEKLSLTERGQLIFRASQPSLRSSSDFSNFCAPTNQNDSVLGCYSDGHIYLYNIKDAELSGIVESTAAHELLHAAWERLSGKEKDRLLGPLNQVFKEHHDALKIIDNYPDSSRASELYARVATEIATLPDELEAHYADYFKNRRGLVAYFDSYSAVFQKLSSALEELSGELAQLDTTITKERNDYESLSNDFSAAVSEFNRCAKTAGCFSESSFQRRRSELLAEQLTLSAKYKDLSAHINHYNELVEKYNANLLHQQDIMTIVNANERKEQL